MAFLVWGGGSPLAAQTLVPDSLLQTRARLSCTGGASPELGHVAMRLGCCFVGLPGSMAGRGGGLGNAKPTISRDVAVQLDRHGVVADPEHGMAHGGLGDTTRGP